MLQYEFTVYMTGQGDTPKEAWEDAVDHVLTKPNSFFRTDPLPEHRSLVQYPEEDE